MLDFVCHLVYYCMNGMVWYAPCCSAGMCVAIFDLSLPFVYSVLYQVFIIYGFHRRVGCSAGMFAAQFCSSA